MSATLDKVRKLVACGEVLVSRHGLRELANDDLPIAELVASLDGASVVEDYPNYWKGPAVLMLHVGQDGRPIHVLWGIERRTETPAVVVTAYRPEAGRWTADFLTRRV